MFLKIVVLIAAIAQVVGAGYLSIGTFETTERLLPVFIQPASWAFSIWGLIYTLSFVYAIYQLIPKFDNELLHKTRIPAIVAFLGSLAWLYFAGAQDWQVWLTAPTLFLIALVLAKVVLLPDAADTKTNLFSKQLLYPYAAWTGIACWLNIQTLLVDQSVITSDTINIIANALLFVAVAVYALKLYTKSGYSAWYGGVIVWASTAIVAVNGFSGVGLWFSAAAIALALVFIGLFIKNLKRTTST